MNSGGTERRRNVVHDNTVGPRPRGTVQHTTVAVINHVKRTGGQSIVKRQHRSWYEDCPVSGASFET